MYALRRQGADVSFARFNVKYYGWYYEDSRVRADSHVAGSDWPQQDAGTEATLVLQSWTWVMDLSLAVRKAFDSEYY